MLSIRPALKKLKFSILLCGKPATMVKIMKERVLTKNLFLFIILIPANKKYLVPENNQFFVRKQFQNSGTSVTPMRRGALRFWMRRAVPGFWNTTYSPPS